MPVFEHRNIVLFLFDSLGFDDFDRMCEAGDLPTLSQLKADSTNFTRCYTPCPESSPARASLFTGLDPAVHGLWTNGVTLSDAETTFPKRLSDAGYSTYLAGRYQLAGVSRWTTEQTRAGDFDQMDWAHGPLHRSRQNAYLKWLEKHAPENHSALFTTQANPDQTNVTHTQRAAFESFPDELSFNRWVGNRIGRWIKNDSEDSPFLAVAGFSVGDGLGAEPSPDGDCEGLKKKSLQQADTAIGRIIETLKTGNPAEDTVLVVASARGNCTDADNQMNELSIKVPLLVGYPNCDKKIITTPVSTIDIAPTVLQLASVAPGPHVQAACLPGVVEEIDQSKNWALSRLRASTTSGLHNWKTSFCFNNMKLVVQHGVTENTTDTLHLYNLDDDPKELHCLALDKAHQSILEDMIDQMIDARCAQEDRTEPRIADF